MTSKTPASRCRPNAFFVSLLRAFWFAGLVSAVTVLGAPAEGATPGQRKILVDGTELPSLGFAELASYPFKIVDAGTGATPAEIAQAKTRDQVPDWLKAFNGQRVVLTGYLMALQVDDGLATKLMLMRDVNTCCYGRSPEINDYVVVTMKGKGIREVMDIPVKMVGVLRVGQHYEEDYLVSVYEFEGERLVSVEK